MTVAAVSTLLGTLTLVAAAATVLAAAATAARRDVSIWEARAALSLAASIAIVATLGSLYYSLVAGFPPCDLCWYQRIAIYPQAIILSVAMLRDDLKVAFTTVPIALVGAGLSAWHMALERAPTLTGPCSATSPCTVRWVEEFGLLTIPTMAFVTSISIVALSVLAAQHKPQRS